MQKGRKAGLGMEVRGRERASGLTVGWKKKKKKKYDSFYACGTKWIMDFWKKTAKRLLSVQPQAFGQSVLQTPKP
jgi:hypothetical protein